MLRRVLLVLAGGLALWSSFPSLGWWWAAPLGIALLTLGTVGAGAARGALLGLIGGLAFFYPLINWVGVYLGPLPIVALVTLEALYVAAAGAAMGYVQHRRTTAPAPAAPADAATAPPAATDSLGSADADAGDATNPLPASGASASPRSARRTEAPGGLLPAVRPLAVAVIWTAAEWIRASFPFGGFAWGRLPFGQADAPWLPGIAYVGTTGMTFVLALMGACLAAVIHRLAHSRMDLRKSEDRAARAAQPTGAATAVAGRNRRNLLVPAAGALLLAVVPSLLPRTIGPDDDQVQVMAVQGNVPRAGLDFNAQRRAVTDNHARATIMAAQQIEAGTRPRPELVVWPENSSDIDPTRNADAQRVIMSAVQAVGVPTVVGAVLTEPADQLSNTALLYFPAEGIVDRYVKQRPVPFAEYVPYRAFFRSITSMVDLLSRDFAQGTRDVVFTVPREQGEPIRLATPICFEVSIDEVMGDHVRLGANLLAVPTNNATFGFTDESVQQLGISRVRAVEFGRGIVHVSTVGVSALITPDGAAHQTTDLFTQEALSGTLPLRSAMTPATHLRSVPGALSVLGALGILVMTARRRRSAHIR